MYLSEYCGRILPTGEFKSDDFLISLKEAFKCHWRNGHHPSLGKDTLLKGLMKFLITTLEKFM